MDQIVATMPEPLIGTDEVSIDDKGRVLVPQKKRERLGAPFAIGIGVKGCLVAYTRPAWIALNEQLKSGDALDIGAETLRELMMGESEDGIDFDPQGRFVIPLRQRRLLSLIGPSLLIGAQDKLEIWTVAQYKSYKEDRRAFTDARWREIEENKFRVGGGLK